MKIELKAQALNINTKIRTTQQRLKMPKIIMQFPKLLN